MTMLTHVQIVVQWILDKSSEKIDVKSYYGRNRPETQDNRYRGRAELSRTDLSKGNMSLILKKTHLSDQGNYTCIVFLGDWYDEVVVELVLAGEFILISLIIRVLRPYLTFPFLFFRHFLLYSYFKYTIDMLKVQIIYCRSAVALAWGPFFFFAANVVLDPKTAHPRLNVSDGKCFWDTGNISKVPNCEERFDSHTFVLAKECFSKGRHYWEVEVGEKRKWDLGVASEFAHRKGEITLSPQNGYWVIGLEGRKNYWARTEQWTYLKVSGKPTKIGIFLNMPAGSLCFYDVHNNRKLYTFSICCSGKLYPFFSTGSVAAELDSQPLKISPWLKEDDTVEEDGKKANISEMGTRVALWVKASVPRTCRSKGRWFESPRRGALPSLGPSACQPSSSKAPSGASR
uniref:B30.2/SPRY domain-containing protein n=1 Tax=Podarcis muralis TaxID=64176 RepID=A0A670JG73_PODMU